jgi:hypothetical protein
MSATAEHCVNCNHPAHHGDRCTGLSDDHGDWCACSWPDPGNYTHGPQFDELCSTCDGDKVVGSHTHDPDVERVSADPLMPCPDCGGTGLYVDGDRQARDYLYGQVVELSTRVDELSGPTPDDILAALVADQVASVRIESWGAPGREHRVFVTVVRGGVRVAEQMAPTLSAALGAAFEEATIRALRDRAAEREKRGVR